VSGPQGRANGLVGSTVHDQTSPSPRPGENYKARQNSGLIADNFEVLARR